MNRRKGHIGMAFAEAICELLKLLRTRWMSCRDISSELGLSLCTAYRWVDTCRAHGILRDAKGVKRDKRVGGRVPRVYSLAPEWGGTA